GSPRAAAVDRADQHIHPITLDQLPRLGQAHVGLGLVVLLDELDLAPTNLVADLGEVELDPFAGLLAVDGDHAGIGQKETALDRRSVLPRGWRAQAPPARKAEREP